MLKDINWFSDGLASGTFFHHLKKGDTFKVNNKTFVVKSISDKQIRVKSDTENITIKKYLGYYYGNTKYNNFSCDIEGQFLVDLLNIDNPFHIKSDIFNGLNKLFHVEQ